MDIYHSKQIKQAIALVLLLLLLGATGVFWLLSRATARQDLEARLQAQQIMQATLQDKRAMLGKINHDYAMWDDLAAQVNRKTPDQAWLRRNVTASVYEVFGVSHVALLDELYQPFYILQQGEVVPAREFDLPLAQPVWQQFLTQARSRHPAQAPLTAWLPIQGQVYLVAAQLVDFESRSIDKPTTSQVMLLFAKPLLQAILPELQSNGYVVQYHTHPDSVAADQVSLALSGLDERPLGHLHWQVALPGVRLWQFLMWPLGLIGFVFLSLGSWLMWVLLRQSRIKQQVRQRLLWQGDALRRMVRYRFDSANDNLQAPVRYVMEQVAQVLQAARVSVWQFDETQTRLVCIGAYLHGQHTVIADLVCEEHADYIAALAGERYLAIQDTYSASVCVSLMAYLHEHEVHALLDASIMVQNEFFGVLCVEQVGALREWHTDEINFVCSAADLLALLHESVAKDLMAHQLQQQFYYDALTGLPNYKLLRLQWAELVSQAAQNWVVLLLSLEGLAFINVHHGQEVGDEVLRVAAQYLHGLLDVNNGELLARVSGRRFALIWRDTALAPVDNRINQLLRRLQVPWSVGSLSVHLQPRLGADRHTLLAQTPPSGVWQHVEFALAQARRQNEGQRCVWFEPEMDVEAQQRQSLLQDLYAAVNEKQFLVLYQPFVDLRNGQVVGAEALVRWQHPSRGLLSPVLFIPLAEEHGVIVALGGWVLEQVCQQLAQWRAQGFTDLTVAVNVSVLQLQQNGFATFVLQLLEQYALPSCCLELEVTESLALTPSAVVEANLAQLAVAQVRLAIDDFGTGYASFSFLRRFSVQKLKIDKSFVDHVLDSPQGATLVRTIIGMGTSLAVTVTGEGIESAEQGIWLAEQGCTYGQGYHFGRPLMAAEFLALCQSPAPSA